MRRMTQGRRRATTVRLMASIKGAMGQLDHSGRFLLLLFVVVVVIQPVTCFLLLSHGGQLNKYEHYHHHSSLNSFLPKQQQQQQMTLLFAKKNAKAAATANSIITPSEETTVITLLAKTMETVRFSDLHFLEAKLLETSPPLQQHLRIHRLMVDAATGSSLFQFQFLTTSSNNNNNNSILSQLQNSPLFYDNNSNHSDDKPAVAQFSSVLSFLQRCEWVASVVVTPPVASSSAREFVQATQQQFLKLQQQQQPILYPWTMKYLYLGRRSFNSIQKQPRARQKVDFTQTTLLCAMAQAIPVPASLDPAADGIMCDELLILHLAGGNGHASASTTTRTTTTDDHNYYDENDSKERFFLLRKLRFVNNNRGDDDSEEEVDADAAKKWNQFRQWWPQRPFAYSSATHPAIAESIVELLHHQCCCRLVQEQQQEPQQSSSSWTIWDPTCGSGTFLAAALQHGAFETLVGWDSNPYCVQGAHDNLEFLLTCRQQQQSLAFHGGGNKEEKEQKRNNNKKHEEEQQQQQQERRICRPMVHLETRDSITSMNNNIIGVSICDDWEDDMETGSSSAAADEDDDDGNMKIMNDDDDDDDCSQPTRTSTRTTTAVLPQRGGRSMNIDCVACNLPWGINTPVSNNKEGIDTTVDADTDADAELEEYTLKLLLAIRSHLKVGVPCAFVTKREISPQQWNNCGFRGLLDRPPQLIQSRVSSSSKDQEEKHNNDNNKNNNNVKTNLGSSYVAHIPPNDFVLPTGVGSSNTKKKHKSLTKRGDCVVTVVETI